jgi:hypothetical protein
MKNSIRIIKRGTKVTDHVTISAASTIQQRVTRMIVKSWITESRERRRSDLSRLRKYCITERD